MRNENDNRSMIDVPQWPRGWRLVVLLTVMIVTIAVFIPAVIVAGGYLFGSGACDRPETASSICSPIGRLLFVAVVAAIGVPLSKSWTRFLLRKLSVANELPAARPEKLEFPSVSQAQHLLELPLGQRLVSGKVEMPSSSGRVVRVRDQSLIFWSKYPLYKGWLKTGDEIVIVYQRHLNLAMAFYRGSGSSVRGVAAGLQAASVLIAAACISVLAVLKPALASLYIGICGLVIVVDFAYLLLMMCAKLALRDFLDSK